MLRNFFRGSEIDDSTNYYSALKAFQLDSSQDFIRLKSRIGLAAATSYAQLFFSQQKRYQRFRRELELHESERNPLNHEYDVIIVLPPYGTLPKHKISNFLRQSMGIATSAGFSRVSHAQLNSDRVLIGAKRLLSLVQRKKQMNRKVIIISYSFGSAFVRTMIDQMSEEDMTHFKGWLNISGLIFGSPRYHCSDKISFLQPVNVAQRGFSSEQKYFTAPFDSKKIKTVHFLGLKTGSQLTSAEFKQREALKAWGPNDGFISFAPYQNLQNPVVPVMDQGHDMDLSGLGSTVVRTLCSMVSTVPVPVIKTDDKNLSDLSFR